MANSEIETHPIQTISYGYVLGFVLVILFVVLLIVILYFIFGDRIADSYCQIIDNRSCFCYDEGEAPPCCQFGTCDWISQDKIVNEVCFNNPCYLKCPIQFQSTQIPFSAIFESIQPTTNFANLCGWFEPEISNADFTVDIDGTTYYLNFDEQNRSVLTPTAPEGSFSYTSVGSNIGDSIRPPKRLLFDDISSVINPDTGVILNVLDSKVAFYFTLFVESDCLEVSISDDNNIRLVRATNPNPDGTYDVYFYDKNIYRNPPVMDDPGVKLIFTINE